MELRVVQSTVTKDRIARMKSRLHSGQFWCEEKHQTVIGLGVVPCSEIKAYQRIVRVVAGLWHKKRGFLGRSVVLQVRGVRQTACILVLLVDVGGTLSSHNVSSVRVPATRGQLTRRVGLGTEYPKTHDCSSAECAWEDLCAREVERRRR